MENKFQFNKGDSALFIGSGAYRARGFITNSRYSRIHECFVYEFSFFIGVEYGEAAFSQLLLK